MGPWGVERVELPTAVDRVASRNWNNVCKKVHCVDFCTHESFGLLVLIFQSFFLDPVFLAVTPRPM